VVEGVDRPAPVRLGRLQRQANEIVASSSVVRPGLSGWFRSIAGWHFRQGDLSETREIVGSGLKTAGMM
jgi:hypothetical protein